MGMLEDYLNKQAETMRAEVEAASQLSPVGDYYQSKIDRVTNDMAPTRADAFLSGVGATGSVAGDTVGLVTDPITGALMKIPPVQVAVEKAGEFVGGVAKDYPLAAQRIGNSLDALSVLPPARMLRTLLPDSDMLPKKPKDARMLSQNLPNQMQGFYDGGLERVKAATVGIGRGIKNYLIQSTTPSGMADFNQLGISRTMRNAAEGRGVLGDSTREKWGQAAHENLVATQFGDLSPVLSKLDDDYFVHKGVLSMDDFQTNLSLPDADTGPFFRTMLSNWKVKKPQEAVMVVRKDRKGAENSGSIRYDMTKSSGFQRIEKIFEGGKDSFSTPQSLIAAHSWSGGEALTKVQQAAIKKAWETNPKLATLSGEALKKELTKMNSLLPDKQGFAKILSDVKKGAKKGYSTNDEVHQALVAAGVNPKAINRNKDQDSDPDVYVSSSAISSLQELGGVNIVYKVGKDGKMTALVSDDYDLFGVRAPGSKRLITVMEPIEFDLSISKAAREMQDRLNDTQAKRNANVPRGLAASMRQIEKGVTPTRKDKMDAYGNQANLGLLGAVAARQGAEQYENNNDNYKDWELPVSP